MDLFILDTNFQCVKVLDEYKSMIWTERYQQYGDFEIYTQVSLELLEYLQLDYYIVIKDSDYAMIIEKIEIASDAENGDYVTITGRSLESILDRRIIWKLKTVNDTLEGAVETLLNECIISPTDEDRKIENFYFQYSGDEEIEAMELEAQYTGDNLYDVIQEICSERDLGFKVLFDDDYNFVFSLYKGTDRSYDQTENPYVIFSPKYENVVDSNYITSKSALKTITLIGGEGEGTARTYAVYSASDDTGLDRREYFTDARDISSDEDESTTMTAAEYQALLQQRGAEKLAENIDVTSFEGEVDTSNMFVYGEDFFEGDIVQLVDNYGHDCRVRVTEFVISVSENGTTTYPTFEVIEEDEDA